MCTLFWCLGLNFHPTLKILSTFGPRYWKICPKLVLSLMRARDSLGKKLCLYSREVLVARRTLLRSVQTASTSTTLPDNPSSSFSPNPSSSSSPSSISPAESSSTQFDYRNLLQSCSRIFADDTPLKSSVWRNRLFKAEQTLKPDKKRKTRIAGMYA